MKITEIITEGHLPDDIRSATPATFALPNLKNNDFYCQYRFGLALAGARAREEDKIAYGRESDFGENMIVVAYTPEEEKTLDLALKLYGEIKRAITTPTSREAGDVNAVSPFPKQKSA